MGHGSSRRLLSGLRRPGWLPLVAVLAWAGVARGEEAPEDGESGGEIVVEEARAEIRVLPGATVTTLVVGDDASRVLDLGDLLSASAGVHVRSAGGVGAAQLVQLRGAAGGEVRVLVDGVPLAQDASGALDLSALPLDQVERIEVHRGVLPLGLGGEGGGGAIHIVTRRPEGLGSVELVGGGGSFHTGEGSARLDAGRGPWRLGAWAGGRSSRNDFVFHDDNGTPYAGLDDVPDAVRQNADAWRGDGTLHLRKEGTSDLAISGTGGARGGGVPGPGAAQATSARYAEERGQVSVRLEREGDRLGGSVGGSLQAARQRFDDPEGEVGLGVQDQATTTGAGELESLGELALGRWSLAAAPRLGRQVWVSADAAVDPTAARRLRDRVGLGVEARWEGDRLAAGLREDLLWARARAEGSLPGVLGASPEEEVWSLGAPVGSVAWRVGRGASLRGSAGRASRLPTFPELYGDPAGIAPSEALRPERATTGDLGLDLAGEALGGVGTFSLTAWGRDVQDWIGYVQNSQFTLKAVNFDRVRAGGLEVEASLGRPAGRLGRVSVEAAWSLVATRNLSDDTVLHGKALPGQPLHDVYADATLGTDRLAGGLTLEWDTGNYRDSANLYAVPSRTFLHARVRSRPWREGPILVAEVRNALDHRVEPLEGLTQVDTGGPALQAVADYWGQPLPGRAFFISAAWTFTP